MRKGRGPEEDFGLGLIGEELAFGFPKRDLAVSKLSSFRLGRLRIPKLFSDSTKRVQLKFEASHAR